jgi:hypothetical protein
MDSIPELEKPLPGSQPLRNARHEVFARARAVLVPLLESARAAGYTEMTPGNAAKIDRTPSVRARIKFLSGNDEDQIRRKRENIERELGRIAYANMDDFIRVSARGWPMLDLRRVKKLPDDERRELMAAVKGVRYTENGPAFELHAKLDAIAQLRKMNGLDAPERHEITGKGQGPLTLEALIGASYQLTKPAPAEAA